MACVSKEPDIKGKATADGGNELGTCEGQKGELCGRSKVNPKATRNGR